MTELVSATWLLETDQLHSWAFYEELFSKEECEKIISICKNGVLTPGTVQGSEDFVEDKSIRESKIRFIPPNEEMVWVYQRLTDAVVYLNSQFFKFDLFSFGECLQFTEYNAPSGKYHSHIDRYYNGPIRKLSIVLQLTDENDYEGGDFQLFESDKPQTLSRKQGSLLAFPSYTVHRVTEVTKGTRNSLVGWINGKPFR